MKKSFLLTILFTFLFAQLTFSQTREVSGVVTCSEEGVPLPNVTVMVQPTDIATITDTEGNFTVRVPEIADYIQFSFVGYTTIELPIPEEDIIEVEMLPDVLQLEEFMVVAYGTAAVESFTGAASVVGEDKLAAVRSADVTRALQGSGPGIQVIDASGLPGRGSDIRIRGMSSLYADASPLIVVDGAPFEGNLGSINARDIESISVLKDATAASLYGSRAAGGVIMITTKRGDTDRPRINYSSSFNNTEMAVPYPDKVGPKKHFELEWETFYEGQLDVGATPEEAREYATDIVIDELQINPFDVDNPFTEDGRIRDDAQLLFYGDWYGEMIQPQMGQEHNISASGTFNEGAGQYHISASYLDEQGVFTVQQYERFQVRANVSSQVTDWLEIGTNTSLAHSEEPFDDGAVWYTRSIAPIYPVYKHDHDTGELILDDDGNKIFDYGEYRREWSMWNPLASAHWDRDIFWYDNVSSRNFMNINFLPNLNLRSSLNLDYDMNQQHFYNNPAAGWLQGIGSASKNSFRQYAITQSNVLNYRTTLEDIHNIELMAGQETFMRQSNYMSAARRMFPFGGLYELAAAAEMTGAHSYENNYRLLSFFGNFEYNYDNRYYLTGSIRTDGSSRFHPDTRWGTFWSAGGSWRISEEDFMAGVNWVDNLRLRASYGTVGNDRVGLYAYQGLFQAGMDDGSHAGILASRLPTPELKWETNVQFNVGANFTLFDRLDGSVEYFTRDSRDLLFDRPLPASTGFTSVDANIADVRNEGIEFEAFVVLLDRADFRWDLDVNATHYTNEITSLPEDRVGYWIEGVCMYENFMPEWAGVNPETGNGQWWKNIFETDEAGDRVLDDDGNPIVEDRVKTENYDEVSPMEQRDYQGSGIPDLYGGITNSFTYQNFDLSIFLYYSIGGKLYDGDYSGMMGNRRGFSHHEDMEDRWTPENTETDVPRLSTQTTGTTGVYSTRFLYDNTFLRVRNITLGYSLPRTITDRLGMESARVYVQGNNLFTFGSAADRGTDPEQSFRGATGHRQPPNRITLFGVEVQF